MCPGPEGVRRPYSTSVMTKFRLFYRHSNRVLCTASGSLPPHTRPQRSPDTPSLPCPRVVAPTPARPSSSPSAVVTDVCAPSSSRFQLQNELNPLSVSPPVTRVSKRAVPSAASPCQRSRYARSNTISATPTSDTTSGLLLVRGGKRRLRFGAARSRSEGRGSAGRRALCLRAPAGDWGAEGKLFGA